MLDGARPGERDSGPEWLDTADPCPDLNGDFDSDGIPNGVEDCRGGRDSDNDGVPDWQDNDSDNDKVQDHVKRGKKDASGKCKNPVKPGATTWPCDSDGDKLPDYLDKDSDDDGQDDGFEDENGDGLVGCCLSKCNTPGSVFQKTCKLTADGCGSGQKCVNGNCSPSVAFKCSDGETDARKQDTFGDGLQDNARGIFICRDATAAHPVGRKPLQYKKSYANRGDWNVALEKSARYAELTIANAGKKEYAAAIDQTASTEEVAGFVLSLDTTNEDVQAEQNLLITRLRSSPPGGSKTKITLRTSGVRAYNHSFYDSVQRAILELTLATATDVSSARNVVVAALLGKPLTDLSNLPQGYGNSSTSLVLTFSTVRRMELIRDKSFKVLRDSNGKPLITGDKSKWRTLVIGALAGRSNYEDPKVRTGIIADDLANNTALGSYYERAENECDLGANNALPVADIIWVVDETYSTKDIRQGLIDNASSFITRASDAGLDFRMGVTGFNSPSGAYKSRVGSLCNDRFLLPSEQTSLATCLKNPPGYAGSDEYSLVNASEAVNKHLPRAANNPSKIRPGATLMLIVVTDEIATSLEMVLSSSRKTCSLSASVQTSLDSALLPYLRLFFGQINPEAKATLHLIGGTCNNSCGADVNHGLATVAARTGGQIANICQKNIGPTLQVMINSIVGAASPVGLEFPAISSSLAVALDTTPLDRSRTNGFDYNLAQNNLTLYNTKYQKGSHITASYKYWELIIPGK